MLRVLHAISGITPANGGPPIALAGLARAQVKAGIYVHIVATWVDDPAPEARTALEAQGIKVTQIGPARDPMSRHRDTARVLHDLAQKADIVHVHAMWEQIQHLACRAAVDLAKPLIVTPHGMLDRFNMTKGWLKKRLYFALRMKKNLNRARAMHFATAMERDEVARWGLRPRAIVEPFGIDAAEYATPPAAGTFRAKHPQLAGKRVVMFLGRLDYGKGLEILIPAFASLGRTDAMLVIVGPDSHSGYRATVEKLIQQHGLGGRTILTGMLSGTDKLAALVDADILCHPSFHENFGIAVMEALACGCPAVVSDQVYVHRDLDAATVALVCPLDTAATARRLAELLDDDARRTAMAARARPFVMQNYDWDTIGRRWRGHYESVLK